MLIKVSLDLVVWPCLMLLGVVEEEQMENPRLQKVERLLSNKKAKKGRDHEERKDGKPLVRG